MAATREGRKISQARTAKRVRTTTKKRSTGAKAKAKAKPAAPKNVAVFRDLLTRGVLTPLNLVMLTRERIQEALDEAVERGRMTRSDARDLLQGIVQLGRKQTEDVLADLEKLLGKGRDEPSGGRPAANERATKAAIQARRRVEKATAPRRRKATTKRVTSKPKRSKNARTSR